MLFKYTRRSFFKIVGGGLSALGLGFHCKPPEPLSIAESSYLFEGFKNPPSSMRPFYRWWWNGNCVTEEEIIRELDLIKSSGAGGVEINPIAFDASIKNPKGRALVWLSFEWNELILTAIREAAKRDLAVDMIVGTGWPFGARFLNDDETIQGLELEIVEINGPKLYRGKIEAVQRNDQKLMQLLLYPKKLNDLKEGHDFTDKVAGDGTFNINVPAGNFELYILTWRNKFREVLFGAPGADGPVLDHFNKNAVEKYLRRMSDKLGHSLGGSFKSHIRSMFCDSIELAGANWTSDLETEFEKRRGYSIKPYLALVLDKRRNLEGDLSDLIMRVRYDFSRTMAELFMERFIKTFHDWCGNIGVLSRYQSYGHPWIYTDLLEGYLIPDIPESDQWLFNRGWIHWAELDQIRYATFNKYASSGAHLTNRKVVSCEAMTNTSGVFRASLEYIKQATDIDIVCGINHLVVHGFNYSPPMAGFPGWIRFGTYFNENNPWWPYLKLWMDYAARLSWLFQQSEPSVNVAILGPTADIWSRYGLDRIPWITQPWYLHALWQSLNHHGYCADYINERVLQEATCESGTLCCGPMRYEIVIAANLETIEPKTAQALSHFVENGGKIVFCGAIPRRSPGLHNHQLNDESVYTKIEKLLSTHPENILVVDEPRMGALTEKAGVWMKHFAIPPEVQINNPDEKLFFIHHKKGEREIYFFSNMDRDRIIAFWGQFPASGKMPFRWNPETGERHIYTRGQNKTKLLIQLAPLESFLLVFEPDPKEISVDFKKQDFSTLLYEIEGPWNVLFERVDGRKFERTMTKLLDFVQDEALRSFSGSATYHATFKVEEITNLELDLGKVCETAEVSVNGHSLGVRWWGQKKYILDKTIVQEENTIEIKVTNLLFNYCRSLKNNPVAEHWADRCRDQRLMTSGLLGPVRIFKVKV